MFSWRSYAQPGPAARCWFSSSCWRLSSSASSSRWLARNRKDVYVKETSTKGLMSRAAWKLIEIDEKYKLFKRGQTVVDLGYAPGSWTQVAVERTKPNGAIIGVDLIPALPPRGVSTIQGNFLDPAVQDLLKRRLRQMKASSAANAIPDPSVEADRPIVTPKPSYIDMGKLTPDERATTTPKETEEKLVDVVLSDMSEPWGQMSGSRSNTLNNPYHRLMNTSGSKLRDHSGSMDLCNAALRFASDTLKTGGNFVCKFYQGSEDKALEEALKKVFKYVHREKPNSSRKESRESFFVALHKRPHPTAASSGKGKRTVNAGEEASNSDSEA